MFSDIVVLRWLYVLSVKLGLFQQQPNIFDYLIRVFQLCKLYMDNHFVWYNQFDVLDVLTRNRL